MDRGHQMDAEPGEARALAEEIVAAEWEMFQHTQNEGGRAECQDDLATFEQMRLAQFSHWPAALLRSYRDDLARAAASGRNLVTEKYARMMASTEPERYAHELAPHLPVLTPERELTQERIISQQVAWAREFQERYPRLGRAMRVLRTAEDTIGDTSFETYLRGELGTYSEATIARYADLVAALRAEGRNLSEEVLRTTVQLGGWEDLPDAEADQPA